MEPTTRFTGAVIVSLIKQALDEFGRYSYLDKGPGEVMDVHTIAKELNTLDSYQVVNILLEVLDTVEVGSEFTEMFVSDVLTMLSGILCDEVMENERLGEIA